MKEPLIDYLRNIIMTSNHYILCAHWCKISLTIRGLKVNQITCSISLFEQQLSLAHYEQWDADFEHWCGHSLGNFCFVCIVAFMYVLLMSSREVGGHFKSLSMS
jgi:hypothetical protein